jgi:dephospho-CoA kinase
MSALRLGLTGGIGSGKSTVAGMLARMGAGIVDADAIARAATQTQGCAIAAVEEAFGSHLLTADRALDRARMRNLVFSDPAAKAKLEAIIHPHVGKEIARQAEAAEMLGVTCVVFDIPLLVESGHWRKSLDRILVIDCTEATQIARVTARSGLDAAGVGRILATQARRHQRLSAADWVLFNEGLTMDALEREVQQFCTLFGL